MAEATKQPKLSIGMPVFNGELFIAAALRSLLSLDYDDYEIIILDNMSTDRTEQICRRFAESNNRIRYIRDPDPCSSHEASGRLAEYATGEFFMVACDDDLWDKFFARKLMRVFETDSSVDLVYSRFNYVDSNGHIAAYLPGGVNIDRHDRPFKNFVKYLFKRSCVPLVFGIFRLEPYRRTLPFKVFDDTLWDADNHYLLSFLSTYKAHCVDERLFFYRIKDRAERAEGSTDAAMRFKTPNGAFSRLSLYWRHQLRFLSEIFGIVNGSGFSWAQKVILKLAAILSLLLMVGMAASNTWPSGGGKTA